MDVILQLGANGVLHHTMFSSFFNTTTMDTLSLLVLLTAQRENFMLLSEKILKFDKISH